MRKLFSLLLILALVTAYVPGAYVFAENNQESQPELQQEATEQNVDPLNLQVRSAVLMDVETGQVLYSKNEHVSLPPASVTKVMTMLIVLEAIERGQTSWDDIVTTSDKAHRMTGSQVFLAIGERATVEELFEAIAIYSANDGAVALAEHIAGSEEIFVNLMNEKARELGMRNTRFLNVTGFPYIEQHPNFNDPDGHTMSAMDIAIVSRELVKRYPEAVEYTKIPFATFKNGVDMPTRNNIMLRHDWVDGLKTGFTNEAQFCLAATGVQNGQRLVSVIMGAESDRARQDETLKLLNYGYNNFEKLTMVRGKEDIESTRVEKGKERDVILMAAENLNLVVEKGAEDSYTQVIEIYEDIVAPIEANTVLGQIYYTKDGALVGYPVNLVAKEDVEKGGFFRLLTRGVKDTFVNIFEGIADSILGIFTKDNNE
ncbi:D-alanyl-D-alanine carboxypeptidase family protein [Desulfuribacillus alkaliarsenatis]|uniref:serine-type D-Ala-D-Ala carboxypeptidase n=1 Tax=Desulfuribacillus alkaliarsenatis TaxID=766136 RepID=A0A1E5G3E7_9FIRM|nr:D-alanyl-D-alanine carboxypeptidase family protein [Desulfuribacillus alkaliarsenatis]OEF97600.1 hypothetical protein BHF68_14675 [Desulfuribacillus alkaliarsenatis]